MNNEEKYVKTHQFILNRWDCALRCESDPEYPLPYPFVPPCVDGDFKCLFYWDTFYTNRGMILDGKSQYAKWNADNLIYLLNKYGYVPNSNSYPGLQNSQPPYLQYIVRDVYECFQDDNWLKEAYYALKKEYAFWMNNRMTPIGLNQHLHCPNSDEDKISFYDYVCTRVPQLDKDAPRDFKIKVGSGYHAAGEAGLDFSPRFHFDGVDIVEVDLNAHLYALEGFLAEIAGRFEPNLAKTFKEAQGRRKELMDKYLLDKDGLYYDYNFVKKQIQQKDFNFTGQFVPFIVGLSTNSEALKTLLKGLEFTYGIASTGPFSYGFDYQAAYPFSWPYDNGLAFWALTKMNLKEEYERVGRKYLEMCANSFIDSGRLWESYDATKYGIAEKKEYPATEMLGWTGGIYEWIYLFLFHNKKMEY